MIVINLIIIITVAIVNLIYLVRNHSLYVGLLSLYYM